MRFTNIVNDHTSLMHYSKSTITIIIIVRMLKISSIKTSSLLIIYNFDVKFGFVKSSDLNSQFIYLP